MSVDRKNETMKETMNIRFRHIPDTKKPARVLTVATRLTDNLLEFGFAVNHPPRLAYKDLPDGSFNVRPVPGDKFSRPMGRRIALGKMNSPRGPRAIHLEPGQNPYEVVLQAIAADPKDVRAASIARQALRSFRAYQVSEADRAKTKTVQETGYREGFPTMSVSAPVFHLRGDVEKVLKGRTVEEYIKGPQ